KPDLRLLLAHQRDMGVPVVLLEGLGALRGVVDDRHEGHRGRGRCRLGGSGVRGRLVRRLGAGGEGKERDGGQQANGTHDHSGREGPPDPPAWGRVTGAWPPHARNPTPCRGSAHSENNDCFSTSTLTPPAWWVFPVVTLVSHTSAGLNSSGSIL